MFHFSDACKSSIPSANILNPNNYIFNLGLVAYLTDVSAGDFWIGKLTDIAQLSEKITNWADGGRDDSLDCVIADPNDEFRWKSKSCTASAIFFCEASQPQCPPGYIWVSDAGPNSQSCFKIANGGEFNVANNKFIDSITTAEAICLEDGTRLAAPESLIQRKALVAHLERQDLFYTGHSDTGDRIEDYWMGYRPFKHSDTKDDECTTCNFEDLGISVWKSVALTRDELRDAKGGDITFDKCLFIKTGTSGNMRHLAPCYQFGTGNYHTLCEFRECKTISDKVCKFPFKFGGRSYDTCITFGMPDGQSFCATEVDGNNTLTARETCLPTCSVNDCPIGFHLHVGSCIRVSAIHSHDTVSSVKEAEDICLSQGSRLYQPRSTKTLKSLIQKNPKLFHNDAYKINARVKADLKLVIGVYLDGNQVPHYKDGSKFPYELIQTSGEWSWDSGFDLLDTNKSCIFIKNGNKFINDECEASDAVMSYICEARPMETLDDPQTSCHFPFKRTEEDEWQHSCMYEKNSKVEVTSALRSERHSVNQTLLHTDIWIDRQRIDE